MRSAVNALRASGLKRSDVVALVRRFPLVLAEDAEQLKKVVEVLRERCGLSKVRNDTIESVLF